MKETGQYFFALALSHDGEGLLSFVFGFSSFSLCQCPPRSLSFKKWRRMALEFTTPWVQILLQDKFTHLAFLLLALAFLGR